MNVCKVPDMCKDMEYKYITEDSKTTAPTVLHTPYTDIACIPGFDKQEFRAKFPGLSADEENLAWSKYISDMVFALRAECEARKLILCSIFFPSRRKLMKQERCFEVSNGRPPLGYS